MRVAVPVMRRVPTMAGPMPGPTLRDRIGMSLVRKSTLMTLPPLRRT